MFKLMEVPQTQFCQNLQRVYWLHQKATYSHMKLNVSLHQSG